jgi:hypothetical protein
MTRTYTQAGPLKGRPRRTARTAAPGSTDTYMEVTIVRSTVAILTAGRWNRA